MAGRHRMVDRYRESLCVKVELFLSGKAEMNSICIGSNASPFSEKATVVGHTYVSAD